MGGRIPLSALTRRPSLLPLPLPYCLDHGLRAEVVQIAVVAIAATGNQRHPLPLVPSGQWQPNSVSKTLGHGLAQLSPKPLKVGTARPGHMPCGCRAKFGVESRLSLPAFFWR